MRRLCGALALLAGCTSSPAPGPAKARPPDLELEEVCQHPPPPEVKARAELEKELATSCDGVVAAVVAGRALPSEGPAPLREPALRTALGDAVRLYLECRAIADDSDGPCDRIGDAERVAECRMQRALFHGARTPADPSWRLPEAWVAHCRTAGAGAACDAYAKALRGRDPARCPKSPRELSDCPALASGDPAKCTDPRCAARAKRYQLIGEGGLGKLADGGDEGDRTLAAAALGRKEACEGRVKAVREVCLSALHVNAPPRKP